MTIIRTSLNPTPNTKNPTLIHASLFIISLAIFILIVSGCTGEKLPPGEQPETMNSGKLTVWCDQSVYFLMDTLFTMYEQDYREVMLTKQVASARKVMTMLLSGNARIVVVSRDYLKDEDSLMLAFKVQKHFRFAVAEDALVFFTTQDFPLDTINASQLCDALTKKGFSLAEKFPKLGSEPELVVADQNSSEYANLSALVSKGKPLVRNLKMFATTDSVKQYVMSNSNSIGIGFLSQIIRNIGNGLKPLAIGFTDSTGKYCYPRQYSIENVASGIQVNVVRRLYPYVVTHYAYLLEDNRQLPFWFATFLAKETKAQRYIKDFGIVPMYAKLVLIPEE